MFKWVKCAPNAPKIVKGVHQDSLTPKIIIFHDAVGLESKISSSAQYWSIIQVGSRHLISPY